MKAQQALEEMTKRAEAADVALDVCWGKLDDMTAQRDALRIAYDGKEAELRKVEAALAERNAPCVWRKDEDDWWQTGCGKETFVKHGDFCPNCGHPIEVAP